MIYAKLKGLYSPDIADLQNYIPKQPENFGFLLQLFVGASNEAGYESFDVMVCTPQWLTTQHTKEDIIIGRHYLIVFEYNYGNIVQKTEKYLAQCAGQTWQEVAEKVGRFGRWEFEDYQAED